MSAAARPSRPVLIAWGIGALWVLAQICYPLVGGTTRDVVTVTVVLLGAGAGVLHATATRGWVWALWLVVVTAVGGFAVELLGTVSGLPFGHYDYAAGRLGPAVAGVPLLIGVAWTAGAYPAWCAAGRVAPRRRGLRWALAAVGLAGWDLYLDPQ
ncbi:MAG: carotenoid biosynthesis protein, partial [Mycobacteriaceae bacterium]